MSKPRPVIPLYESPIIETHFHLDYLKHLSADEIVATSLKQNVEKMITIAVSPDNLDTVVSLVENYPSVFGTQGIHPHNAKDWNPEVKNKILVNLLKNKIVAVGEIGLDYHYSKSPRENQLAAFEEQLQIAVDFNLPVVVHTRDADEDTIAILKNFSPHLKRGGVIHSFTSGLELAKIAIDLNFYIGFNGIITFKNAHNVREALQLAPLENILLETDAPFLTPEPYRGVENAPYYLPFVAKRIAAEKNVLVEDLLKQVYLNSKILFKFE